MKHFQSLFGIGIILMLSIMLISCGKLSTNTSKTPNHSKIEHFQINSEDISSVTIYTGPVKHEVSGVIKTAADIKLLTDILNSATSPIGDATADFYRMVKINKKDESVISLGKFFKQLDSGIFFKLDPEDKYRELNKLIDRVEKEYTK